MPLENVTSAMISHLRQSSTELATCWYVSLVDGSSTTYRFTADPVSVVVSGETYHPTAAIVPEGSEAGIDLGVDNSSLLGIADVSTITAEDILAGRLDGAEAEVFQVVRSDPDAYGKLPILPGHIGRCSLKGSLFNIEIQGFTNALQNEAGELYLVPCQAELGDSRCKIPVSPSAWTSGTGYASGAYVSPTDVNFGRIFKATGSGVSGGSEPSWSSAVGASTAEASITWVTEDAHTKRFAVTSVVVSSRIFEIDLADPNRRYNLGLVTWISGNNAWAYMDVKVFSSSRVELYEPMPKAISVSDVGNIRRGCDKSWSTCVSTFSNGNNHRGFPRVLGLSKLVRGK